MFSDETYFFFDILRYTQLCLTFLQLLKRSSRHRILSPQTLYSKFYDAALKAEFLRIRLEKHQYGWTNQRLLKEKGRELQPQFSRGPNRKRLQHGRLVPTSVCSESWSVAARYVFRRHVLPFAPIGGLVLLPAGSDVSQAVRRSDPFWM